MTIINRITADLETRLAGLGNRAGAYQLKNHTDLESVVERSCATITVGITRRSQLADIGTRIGRMVQRDLELTTDSTKAIHFGVFVIESFVNLGLVSVDLNYGGDDRNTTYHVRAGTSPDYAELISGVEVEGPDFPSLTPFADWTCGTHENGTPFVRKANKGVLNRISTESTPIPLDAVNRLQRGGWKVNQPVFEAFRHFYRVGGAPKALPHQDEDSSQATRSGLATEAAFIVKIAEDMADNTFYHQYNCDFRGRIYPTSAFLNEQSSDRSKGILVFDEPKPLGENGLYWLMVHTANVWGEDKLKLDDRAQFVQDHFEQWELFAQDPIANTGWMDADKPWSFLAAVIELNNVQYFDGEVADYPCALPIFIDGSNNGVQHMTALTLDETTAPLVNLVPQDLPGDVYMAVCEEVYKQIEADYNPELDSVLEEFLGRLSVVFEGIDNVKRTERSEIYAEAAAIKEQYDIKALSPNYFMRITDPKKRRKLVKRPVMTLGYGGTKGGFTDQIMEDNRDSLRDMQKTWAAYFGHKIYYTCRGNGSQEALLPGLAAMLDLFEGLAMDASENGSKLTWETPVTNFPVEQDYKKAKTKIAKASFMGRRIELSILILEDKSLDKDKQKTSAAPNIVHSFDAAHLQMTVVGHDFRTTTIHDSFGCLPADMDELFIGSRETFVDFYESAPLADLLNQRDAMHRMPQQGTLDLEDIIKSDYSFA